MRRARLVLAFLALALSFLAAQSESALKASFEGQRVRVRQDLPASSDGLDVHIFPSGQIRPDWDSCSKRLRDFGAALREGDTVLVTKLKIKGGTLEFQLGGGGYGTFGDMTDPTVTYDPMPESKRERELARLLETETDRHRLRAIQDELDALRHERERENHRRRERARIETDRRAEEIRIRRQEGGSRINLRFEGKVPVARITPDVLRELLGKFLEFSAEPESSSFRY